MSAPTDYDEDDVKPEIEHDVPAPKLSTEHIVHTYPLFPGGITK
jgi:hypothetical protein